MSASASDSSLTQIAELLHQSFDRQGNTPLDTATVQLMLELSRAHAQPGIVPPPPAEPSGRIKAISGTILKPLAFAVQRAKPR